VTYSTLLQQDSVKQKFLAVLSPKRRVQSWSLVSGFIYKASFTYGKPRLFEVDGVTMTEVFTNTPNASEYYYDESAKEIYLRTPASANPNSTFNVATYEIYAATFDAYWYRVPTDNTTTVVYFEPIISKSPEIKSSSSDALFGFLPLQTSSIELLNDEHWAETHVYDSSFNKGSIKIWHVLGDSISVSNTTLGLDGLMGSVSYNTEKITIETVDRLEEFSDEYRNAGSSFFNTMLFPNVDPNYIGKPIRYVYGYVTGFVPVNVDYVDNSPTTSDNRDWVVIGEQTGLTDISRTVGGGTHTTTRTYISFAEGIQVGDTVWLDRVSGTDEYKEVTAVSYTPAYIEHSALISPMANGDAVKKGFVSRVEIIKDNVKYLALFGRDYTTNLSMAGTSSGFSFTTSLEANLSLPSNLSPNDVVFCTVYGRVNDLTAGGPSFGANDAVTNNITNPVMIIYDLMKSRIGIPESRINLTQFASVRSATAAEGLGLVIPKNAQDGFSSFKDIVLDVLQSSLLRVLIDNDLKWSITRLAPLSSSVATIDEEEITGSFSYSFDYKELASDILVEYKRMERSDNLSISGESFDNVTAVNNVAKYLHGVDKQTTKQSLHFRSSDAQTLANRLAYTLGERRGILSVGGTHKLFQVLLNDTATISRTPLPSFSYVSGTKRTKNAAIIDSQKGLSGVKLELDDQKGIEDNSGSW
jgi:hypothetical protein